MKKICMTALLAWLMLFALMFTVQAQSPQETLNQYISDLQKNPNDYALRERIIKLVQTMKPTPAIPEEARRNYVMGLTLFKDAKNIQDYNDSIEKFKTAVLIAPWWIDAYRDLGMALKAAERYSEAINALKLYIAANPDSDNARKAQDEIYIIEAKKEKAAKELSPEAMAKKKQSEYDAWLKSLDGARFVKSPVWDPIAGKTLRTVIYISGREVRWGSIWGENVDLKTAPIESSTFGDGSQSKEIYGKQFSYGFLNWTGRRDVATGTISDDGQSITVRAPDNQPMVYSRVK